MIWFLHFEKLLNEKLSPSVRFHCQSKIENEIHNWSILKTAHFIVVQF